MHRQRLNERVVPAHFPGGGAQLRECPGALTASVCAPVPRQAEGDILISAPKSSRLTVIVIGAGDNAPVNFQYQFVVQGTVFGKSRNPPVRAHRRRRLLL